MKNQRGDTLVEVLLATVILSIVLAGAYSLSTRATRLNQSAYERTRATNLIQEQAELLRSARQDPSSEAQWLLIKSQPTSAYYDCRADTALLPPDLTNGNNPNFFYLEASGGSVSVVDGGPSDGEVKTTDGLYHTWVAREDTGGATPPFLDFYIYTCWEGIGSIGNQVAGTVIRLENR